ncbi:hypothetical protein HN51_001658 [Arachis hypogaea]
MSLPQAPTFTLQHQPWHLKTHKLKKKKKRWGNFSHESQSFSRDLDAIIEDPVNTTNKDKILFPFSVED